MKENQTLVAKRGQSFVYRNDTDAPIRHAIKFGNAGAALIDLAPGAEFTIVAGNTEICVFTQYDENTVLRLLDCDGEASGV